jgi:hypothetical protein
MSARAWVTKLLPPALTLAFTGEGAFDSVVRTDVTLDAVHASKSKHFYPMFRGLILETHLPANNSIPPKS